MLRGRNSPSIIVYFTPCCKTSKTRRGVCIGKNNHRWIDNASFIRNNRLNAERGVLMIVICCFISWIERCRMFYQKFGFKIFTHYMRLRYRLFRYNPSYRILACLKHILQKRVLRSQWNLTPMQSLAPRNIEQIVQILLDTLFRNLSSYFIEENYFSISEKYYKPNIIDIIFRFEKSEKIISLKIVYFGNRK